MTTKILRRVVELPRANLEYHYHAASGERELAPLVLLHPWFGCWQFWNRTVAALPEFATYVHVEELLAGIRSSTAVEIPGSGHSPQVDSPQAFTALIRDFLLPAS